MAWDWTQDRVSSLARITEALKAAKHAKRHGFNVEQVRSTIRQAMAAFEAKDYALAIELADRAIDMCGGMGPLPYRGPVR